MQTNNPFFTFIYENINNLEIKISSNVKRWKINSQDFNWIKGSAKGIFGKMFEIMFEYTVVIKRIPNISNNQEITVINQFIDKYSGFYNSAVLDKQKTFKNIKDLKNETSYEQLFSKFVIMIFEISFWNYYNINIDPTSTSALRNCKSKMHQGLRDSIKRTFKIVKSGLETNLNIIHSIKDFFFKFFNCHNDSFVDLINSNFEIKFNWNYRTWNRELHSTNQIREFDISVFDVDENGNLKKLIHVYELKFSERRPMEQIQSVKNNSTDGPIKMYLKFTTEEFKAEFINPIYTILVFTTGEVITI